MLMELSSLTELVSFGSIMFMTFNSLSVSVCQFHHAREAEHDVASRSAVNFTGFRGTAVLTRAAADRQKPCHKWLFCSEKGGQLVKIPWTEHKVQARP